MSISAKLAQQAAQFKHIHLQELFQQNRRRFQQFHIRQNGIVFDYSKQRIDQNVLQLLIEWAKEKQLANWIERLFSDEAVNHTEQRSAKHWALRMPKITDENDANFAVNQAVHQQLDKMRQLVDKIQSGQYRGVTGEKITDVVNIGVGGSDLGPLMVCHALSPYQQNPQVRVHFASTMDGSQLSHVVEKLRPESTLFIISSKSFTTVDTLSNAKTAQKWLFDAFGEHQTVLDCHFIGVSTSNEKMTAWGIHPDKQFNLWQWVGGRYSLWSAIGLPIAIFVGMDNFLALLEGAHFIDQHFQHVTWAQNIPVLMALLGVWNNNFLDIHTHAILPYDGRLEYLTSYLQQLEMESNGKSIRRDGSSVDYSTCPIVWGEVGPNAQHAFYQLLHQGTLTVATDFILAKHRYQQPISQRLDKPFEAFQQQHKLSIANCLAQSRLLAFGSYAVKNAEQLPAYRQYAGNKPSSTLIIPQLTPYYLGALIAMYEHKVFVQSVMWDINPFDQWGVEMGKAIAEELLPYLSGQEGQTILDTSTEGLLNELMN